MFQKCFILGFNNVCNKISHLTSKTRRFVKSRFRVEQFYLISELQNKCYRQKKQLLQIKSCLIFYKYKQTVSVVFHF
jgi:hypothetical protein